MCMCCVENKNINIKQRRILKETFKAKNDKNGDWQNYGRDQLKFASCKFC